jgi:hypothetical protein
MKKFREELTDLINRYSLENGSNTPDFILVHFIEMSIKAFDEATNRRTMWYGKVEDEVHD